MSNKFIPIDRDQPFVIPVQSWLADDHLARFIVAIIDSLDVSALEASYSGGGSPLYPPKMMLALLFYGYVTGIFTSRLIIENHLTQQTNDKQEIKPALVCWMDCQMSLHAQHMVADTGYCSASNAEACEQQNVIPLLACGREAHHPSPEARFADAGEAPPAIASSMERMQHRIKTTEGKKIYAKRKSTVEPVFGVIKQVMGFRQFLLRGLDAVTRGMDAGLYCL